MAKPFPGRIIYVPGKNPKPDALLHRALLWRALKAGLTAAQPACAAALDDESFTTAPWNTLYYAPSSQPTPDFEAIERLLSGNWDAARDQADADSWRVYWQRLSRGMMDRFPTLLKMISDPAVRAVIAETERYFNHDDGIGRDIREVLKAPLRRWLAEGRPVLVIGHSLGSVIAYDALWELTHAEHIEGKLDFLSMGSPLGLRYVQQRLHGADREGAARYPHLIRQWHNVAAIGDLISLDPQLADNFAGMVELGLTEVIIDYFEGVYTHYREAVGGLNPHRSYGYLIHPVTAARVAEWWGRSRFQDSAR